MVKSEPNLGQYPINYAAVHSENPVIIQVLLEAGASIEATDNNGRTALHRAASWSGGNPAVIRTLLNAGADVNAKDDEGQTPLHYAVQVWRLLDVVQILLDAGADVNAKDSNGFTPIDLVRSSNNKEARRLLVDSQ